MDKIVVKNLLLQGIIGINDDERTNKQDILINLTIFTEFGPAALSDDINDAVNYRSITKRIIKHVEESADYLVEKLVTDIARIILTEFDVERVIVRVEKPGALRYAESVGVEIDRFRSDLPE